jgi:L-proline---[L-prolyl-carrier protein] ligase
MQGDMRDYLLQHLLERSAVEHSGKAALVFKEDSLTYGELEERSSRLALKLRDIGARRGDRIGIFLGKSLEMIVSLFAILKAGGIYVPIDPSAPPSRAAFVINHCGIGFLIASSGNLQKLFAGFHEELAIRSAVIVGMDDSDAFRDRIPAERLPWEEAFDVVHRELPPLDISDASPAYILHTSGSTGNPKGVVISHLNALTFVKMAADFFRIAPEDRLCNHAPLHFDLSVFDIFTAARRGATVVLLPEIYSAFPVRLAEFIEKQEISIWNSVSSVLALLVEKGAMEKFHFDSVRVVHFSGDVMPVKILRILKGLMRNASFFNIYGQTEANSSMFYPVREIPESDSWRIPIGRPFPNFDVFALSDSNEIIGRAGEEGELYVNSSTVALGYWNAEGMTNEKFVPDPRCPSLKKSVYRTGDLVRIDEHGDYLFAGRTDQMVKSRGYRIELEEIEAVLGGHPGVKTAIVVPVPDELIGNRIVAVVVPESGGSLKTEEILLHCSERLPKYMIPETIRYRESLPKTSTGKVDRRKVRDMFIESVDNTGA